MKKVLVIEDEQSIGKLICRLVDESGGDAMWVRDPFVAKGFLKSIDAMDLIICDQWLESRMTGLGFIKLVREVSNVPVILFTSDMKLNSNKTFLKSSYNIQEVIPKDFKQLKKFLKEFTVYRQLELPFDERFKQCFNK